MLYSESPYSHCNVIICFKSYKANAATDILWHKVAMNIIATSKIHLVGLPVPEIKLHFVFSDFSCNCNIL